MAFPFYGADGTSGTVAVNNGSPNVTGTGTGWLTNNAVPTAGGYCIKMPDGQIYGIEECGSDTSLVLTENYNGSNISGGEYYIIPTAASMAALLNQVSQLLNSSSYSQIAGLAGNSGDFIQYLAGTWTTRTPSQVLLNLLNSFGEVNVASASTCDIGAATSPKVQITGTTTITGFGTQANAVRYVRFGGALTLTHNATSLILPAGANITTASGDAAIFLSDASGNWRCWDYVRASGGPVSASQTATDVGATAALQVSLNAGRPAFLVRRTSSQTNVTGAGSPATVIWDSEIYDRGSNFSGNQFTAPVTGIYPLKGSVLLGDFTTAMTGAQLQLVTSNRTYVIAAKDGAWPASGIVSIPFAVDADMDAADTAYVNVLGTGGVGDTADILGHASLMYTFFSGHLLG